MRAVDIILKKRDGEELTKEEIEFFIHGYTNGDIPDYQASGIATDNATRAGKTCKVMFRRFYAMLAFSKHAIQSFRMTNAVPD